MKKMKNMNYAESVNAFAKFSQKHSITDDYDMNYQVINDITPLLTNREEFVNALYNIYCYGFMTGYRQKEKEIKESYDRHFITSRGETHKNLTELVYHMPCGVYSDFFYGFMVSLLNDRFPDIEKYLPARQRKAFSEELELLNNKISSSSMTNAQ